MKLAYNLDLDSVMNSLSLSLCINILSFKDDHFDDPLTLAVGRDCIILSTGVLLLADTIPSLTVNMVAPFLPLYIKYVRIYLLVTNSCAF